MSYAIIAVVVLILDQTMKFWTTKNIPLDAVGSQCADLIPGVVHITNVHNAGAAFSILQNARWLLVCVTVVFVIGVIVLLSQEIIHGELGRWAAVLVMAGALGNGIDRAFYGYVVDMFEFEFMQFPVFNIADIFITVCGILFCVYIIVHKTPEEERTAAAPGGYRVRSAPSRRLRGAEDEEEAPAPVQRTRARSQSAYDAIPKRGEHRTLKETVRPKDVADPFAEWEPGRWEDDEESGDRQLDLFAQPEKKPAAGKHAAAEKAPAPAEPQKKDTKLELDGEVLEFSLDDILSEFGDDKK